VDPAQRRWIVTNALVITAAANVVLNALPAWLATRDLEHVPLWTAPAVAGTGVYTDTLGTFLILPFVTTLLCTAAVRRDRRHGRLPSPAPPIPAGLAGLMQLLPSRLLPRAVTFSTITIGLLAAPAAAFLALSASGGMGDETFIAYKTALGVGLGVFVTPLVALRAMQG
jgi:hypothetical protein